MPVPLIEPVLLAVEFPNPPMVAALGPRWRTLLDTAAAGRTTLGGRTGTVLLTALFEMSPPLATPAGLSKAR